MSRRFFVSTTCITQDQAILRGSEFHHLRRVLRLPIGASVVLKDDQGREHLGEIVHLSSTEATIALTATNEAPEPQFSLTLAQGLLKGAKMDFVIEKATELGVRRFIPFHSTFTIATVSTDKQSNRVARWQRIAQSAAKQSGSHTPTIDLPQSFSHLLGMLPSEGTTILCYEKESDVTLKTFAEQHPRLASLCLIVGPEGGFSPEEVESARAAKINIVSLGGRILRAETAGVVASALCQFLWDD